MSTPNTVRFRHVQLLLAGAAIGLLTGCSQALPPAKFRAYLADPQHGLVQTREAAGVTAMVTYLPVPLLVLRDLAHVPTTGPAVRDSLAGSYAGKAYCTLSLSRQGVEIENILVNNRNAYEQAINYLNTGIAADTYLVSSPHDSVAALSSMYLRQYGTTGHTTILLVFDTRKYPIDRGFSLTLDGRRLGLGTLRFPFAARDLNALPALQYE
jgi:hypothetical protein